MKRLAFSGLRLSGAWTIAPMLALLLALPRADAGAQITLGGPGGIRARLEITDSLRPGSFSARRQRLIATLVRQTPDSLYLRINGSEAFGVARAQIHRIDLSHGATRGRSAAVQGIGLGIVGAGFTYLGSMSSDDRGKSTLTAGAIGVVVGAVLGAISPFETWHRVPESVTLLGR
jgi:hypothetical protein